MGERGIIKTDGWTTERKTIREQFLFVLFLFLFVFVFVFWINIYDDEKFASAGIAVENRGDRLYRCAYPRGDGETVLYPRAGGMLSLHCRKCAALSCWLPKHHGAARTPHRIRSILPPRQAWHGGMGPIL